MSEHLLLVALGPVQDFIKQARRTRDLWFGSHLLSELSRAAAKALAAGGARLIFPALEQGDPELEPSDSLVRAGGTPAMNVANKLLAEVPAGIEPQALARAAREATVARLRVLGDGVWQRWREELGEGVKPVWDEQLDTLIEFAAAWHPLQPGTYKAARRTLDAALGGRKALREFSPWVAQTNAVPKSSLDGGRESVLPATKKRAGTLFTWARINSQEELDAVGLLKRAGGDADQFVPIANVALTPWLREAKAAHPKRFEELHRACAALNGLGRVARGSARVRAFGFDAQLLWPDRWDAIFQEGGLEADGLDARGWGRRHVEPLLRGMSTPEPYVACLLADGDRVGVALDAIESPDAHRQFSRRLAEFAGAARRIVEDEHDGALVYAGGDDVLAFVALRDAVAVANALREAFSACMAAALPGAATRPTLSVGLGVGHVLDGLSHLRHLAEQAEQEAKRFGRNALTVLLDKRSGATLKWSASWSNDPVEAMGRANALFEQGLSHKKVYEVLSDLQRFPAADAVGGDAAVWRDLLAKDIGRTLSRSELGSERNVSLGDLGVADDDGYGAAREKVARWVDLMRIAVVIARSVPTVRVRQEVTP